MVSIMDEIVPFALAFSIFFGVLYCLAGKEIREYFFGRPYAQNIIPSGRDTEPKKPRNFTSRDLAQYNGTKGKPIYIAIRGQVFDTSDSAGFYGPGGPYHPFAGRDATIGLATMQVDPQKWEKGSMGELTQGEFDDLNDWLQKFQMKYPLVGYLMDGVDAKRAEEQESSTS